MKRFIKLTDEWLDWKWWNRQPHHALFEWLLIKARVIDQDVQGTTVRRGSVLTTWRKLQEALGCTTGTLSRALKDLSECGEIIVRTEQRKTLITICHYEDYNGYNNTLWSDSGAKTEQKRSKTHLYKEERKNEKDIYSACACEGQGSLPGGFTDGLYDDGFVTDHDCRLWMQRYNTIAASFGAPQAEQLNTKRRLYIQQRVRERGRGSVDAMFKQLEQSAHFFGDGSRGFRGDFTNLWTADVYAKVCEGYYIPRQKKAEATKAQQQQKPPTGSWLDDYQETKKPTRAETREQWRQYAKEHPESRAAKMVAKWDKEEQGKNQINEK